MRKMHELVGFGVALGMLVLIGLFINPTLRAASLIPPDLASGYVFSHLIPLPSTPVQTVYDRGRKQWVTLDVTGNLSVITAQANGALTVANTLENNNPDDFSANLVDDPASDTVYWINGMTQSIQSLVLETNPQQDAIQTVATFPVSPQFLTVGPRGQTLYAVDPFSNTLTWLPAGGGSLDTLSLPNIAYGPAAVYAANQQVAVFIPSTENSSIPGDGSVMRVLINPQTHRAGPVSIFNDPALPTSLALGTDGTLYIAHGSPINPVFSLSSVPDAVYAVAIPANSVLAPHAAQGLDEPGALGIDAAGNLVLPAAIPGTASAVLMVYAPPTGTFQTYPQVTVTGPLAQASGQVWAPTGLSSIAALSMPNPSDWVVNGLLPPPNPSGGQLAVGPGGSLLIPNANGAERIGVDVGATPELLNVPQATGAVAFDGENPVVGGSEGWYFFHAHDPLATIQATDGNELPLAGAVQSSTLGTLLSTDALQLGNAQPEPAPAGASNLLAVNDGWEVLGNGNLTMLDSHGQTKATLRDPAYAGPAAATPDGSLLLAEDGQSPAITLVSLATDQRLGTIALTLPGNLALPVSDLAISPHGHWLYLLTANAVAVYSGPTLRLTASAASMPQGSNVTLTATLTDSNGHPVANQRIHFSTGQSAVTNAGGTATLSLSSAIAQIMVIRASAPGVVAQTSVTFTAVPASAIPAPISGGPGAPPKWTITASLPPGSSPHDYPALAVRLHPALPRKLPPGTVAVTFQIRAATTDRYFPLRYCLTVTPPAGFHQPFGIWYYSPSFQQWYPLQPVQANGRQWLGADPFLTEFAVTTKPVPQQEIIASSSRVKMAESLAARLFPNGAGTVILAQRGYEDHGPVDALSASGLAAALHAPILLTPSQYLPLSVIQTITRLRPRTIQLIGGANAISPSIHNWLSRQGYRVEAQFAGVDRFQTALLIARYLAHRQPLAQAPLYLADGSRIRHAATLAVLAHWNQSGILLTRGSRIPPATLAWMRRHPEFHWISASTTGSAVNPLTVQSLGLKDMGRIDAVDATGLAVRLAQSLPDLERSGAVLIGAQHALGRAMMVLAAEISRLYPVPVLLQESHPGRSAQFLASHPTLWQLQLQDTTPLH